MVPTQAFSWGICGRPLSGLANFMWWCALDDTWGVSFLFLLYVVSLFAFHYMFTLRTICISSVGEGFRKICFLFSIFYFTISVVISISIFYFNFCVYIYFLFLFRCILFCLFFCIHVLFLFCCCFVLLLFLHYKKIIQILQLLFSNAFIEFSHFLMFFIGFLTCINCEICIIFSWEVSCLMWTIVAIVEVISRLWNFEVDHVW